MITKEDVKNLAELSRIEISDVEMEKMTSEIDSILGYVSVIQDIKGDAKNIVPKLRNVMREDVPTTESGEYTEKLLKNSPNREGDYVKVKKIL